MKNLKKKLLYMYRNHFLFWLVCEGLKTIGITVALPFLLVLYILLAPIIAVIEAWEKHKRFHANDNDQST